jgi:NADH-quinone oxidoreductase subunit C
MFELMLIENVNKLVPKFLLGIIQGQSKCIFVVKQSYLLQMVNFLSRSSSLQFNILSDITAVDYPNNKKRFVVIYSFLSLINNMRVIIKVHISALTYLPSLSNLMPSSN